MINLNIKRKLRAIRAEHGLTQQDLADILGITKEGYRNKENGKTEFKQSEINDILDLFSSYNYDDIFLDCS